VHGSDVSPGVLETLSRGRSHIFEPGVEQVFAEHIGTRIHVGAELPMNTVDVAVISVSTPVDDITRRPNLANLAAAARSVAARCRPGTLVVVRSTVPIGTSRQVVLPELRAAWGDDVRLVMAPERTIQGQALRELVELPQVIGGLDEASLRAGVEFFGGLARTVVRVSDLETAELVKLSNNCHTDLIYSFGNEIALIAERHGLDPLEVIRAANADYPRPDLSKPGYVGGGCLSKDPYIMIDSAGGREPFLVGRARELNEFMPQQVGPHDIEKLMDELSASGVQIKESDAAPDGPACSFCGKPQADVLQLIAGARTFICDECVQLCVGIIGSQNPDWLERHRQFLATLPLKPGEK